MQVFLKGPVPGPIVILIKVGESDAVFCPVDENSHFRSCNAAISDCCTSIGDIMSGIIDSYIPVAIFLVLALVMPPMTMFMVKQLSPRSKAASKYTTYESGSIPTGTARIQFNVEYYLYAIAFVLFDVEVLFLYPWATIYKGHGITSIALIEMFAFVFILLFGYVYLWKKEALTWVK